MIASQPPFEVTNAPPGGRRRRAERTGNLPVTPAVGPKRQCRPALPRFGERRQAVGRPSIMKAWISICQVPQWKRQGPQKQNTTPKPRPGHSNVLEVAKSVAGEGTGPNDVILNAFLWGHR